MITLSFHQMWCCDDGSVIKVGLNCGSTNGGGGILVEVVKKFWFQFKENTEQRICTCAPLRDVL